MLSTIIFHKYICKWLWFFFLFRNWKKYIFSLWNLSLLLEGCSVFMESTWCYCRTKWPGCLINMVALRWYSVKKSLSSILSLYGHIEQSGPCGVGNNRWLLCVLVSGLLLDVFVQKLAEAQANLMLMLLGASHVFACAYKSLGAAVV